MGTRRVITDIPAADVPFVAAMITVDGGRVVEEIPEDDGQVTIVAELPAPANGQATATAALANGSPAPSSAASPRATSASMSTATPSTTSALAAGSARERWMRAARAELGTAEAPGTDDNARIRAYHATTAGGAAPDSVPWCSSFVNFCVVAAGLQGTRSKAARSWMTWGQDAGAFVPGCIVVLQRGAPPNGHVGFCIGASDGHVELLGGNQGDKVSIATFDASKVLARRLAIGDA